MINLNKALLECVEGKRKQGVSNLERAALVLGELEVTKNPRTLERYKKRWGRIRELCRNYAKPGALVRWLLQKKTSNNFYFLRAVARWRLRADVEEAVSALRAMVQQAKSVRDPNTAAALQTRIALQEALLRRSLERLLELLEPVTGRNWPKAKGKRRVPGRLPVTWKEELATEFVNSKTVRAIRYADAYLVQAITGCRTEELQPEEAKYWYPGLGRGLRTGVHVRIRANSIFFLVLGAKCRDDISGQPYRGYRVRTDCPDPLVQLLRERLGFGRHLIVVDDKDNYRNCFTSLAKKLWRRKNAVTPYCLRHDGTSALKYLLRDDDVISEFLGHRSARSRSRYGSTNGGRRTGRSVRPPQMRVPRKVRPVARPDFAQLANSASPRKRKQRRRSA